MHTETVQLATKVSEVGQLDVLNVVNQPSSARKTDKHKASLKSHNSSSTAVKEKGPPKLTILPSHDSLITRIYIEVEKLRNCGMNRNDVLRFID